jgi:glycerol-3-phosphate acyltransferase PlsY
MRTVIKRGIFHISCGLLIALSGLFLSLSAILITLGVLALLLLALELARFSVPSVNRWFLKVFKPFIREEEAVRATGALYILISSFLAYLAFEIHIAMLAIAFLAVGDAVGAIVGSTIGRVKSLKKTLEGDLACFLSCIAIGFIFYFSGIGAGITIIIVGAASATAVEATPLPVNDNLVMPLFSGLMMSLV